MAKLTTQYAKPVGKVRCRRGAYTYLFALRTDGAVLSRITGEDGHDRISTGYRHFAQLARGGMNELRDALKRRGFTDFEEVTT